MTTIHLPTVLSPRNLINGGWHDAPAIDGRWATDPNTGKHLHPMPTTAHDDVEHALSVSDALHRTGDWQDVAAPARAAFLERIADLLESRVDEIAVLDSLTSGVPISTTRVIASFLPFRFRAAADDCRQNPHRRQLAAGGRDVRLLRLPWGPAAVLTPWNAPSFIAASKVASALAAGCPVLFKPSEFAASTAQPLSESVHAALAEAQLPAAAYQTLHGAGDIGAMLCHDPRVKVICFTGGQVAGRSIAAAAATHFTPVQLELGGNNPVLVLHDADIPQTAKSLARGMTLLNGQWCEGPGKVFVHEDAVGDLVEALLAELDSVVIGHSLDDATTLGPLANENHRDRLVAQLRQLDDKGAHVLSPSEPPTGGGYFLAPSLAVGADPADAVAELFGPVVSVHSVGSDEQALTLANAHPSGLDAYVYSADPEHAFAVGSRLVSGEVRINGAHLDDLGAGSAQGFWGPAGIGGHGPAESVRVFSGERVIGVDSDDLVL